ncbi:hypothetical protein KR032_009419 [Drosophila birchii]|nr:hypothetical protein KR032_009419 [Drosophila birchii]
MSQSNISNTDPSQISNLDEEDNNSIRTERSFHSVDNPNNSIASFDSNDPDDSPWLTEGHELEPKSTLPSLGWTDPLTIAVLPRRRSGEMYHGEILLTTVHHNHEPEEHLHSDGDEVIGEPEESRSAFVIGRNHPGSSLAALAGYRYRIQ